MDIEILKGFLRIGVFIGVGGLILALMQTPGTAEFVLSVCSALIGLALIGGVLLVNRVVKQVEGDHD